METDWGYITRITHGGSTDWRKNRLIRVTQTVTIEGTKYVDDPDQDKMIDEVESFAKSLLNTKLPSGYTDDVLKYNQGTATNYHLTNLTVTAERTWFDYTAEFQRTYYPNQTKSDLVEITGIKVNYQYGTEVESGSIKIYDARVTNNPPSPRTVDIYIPNMDGAIIQEFGWSNGTLSIEGAASGYCTLDTNKAQIKLGDSTFEGVIKSLSTNYDPKLDETNISLTISYQPT